MNKNAVHATVTILLHLLPTLAMADDLPIRLFPKYSIDESAETKVIQRSQDPAIPVLPPLSNPYHIDMYEGDNINEQYAIGSFFDPQDESRVYVRMDSSLIKLEDNGHRLWRFDLDRNTHTTTSVSISPRGTVALMGDLNGELTLVDTVTGAMRNTITQACDGACTAVTMAPDESFIAVGTSSGRIHLLTIDGQEMASWQAFSWPVRNIKIYLSSHGNLILAHDWSALSIYDMDRQQELRRYTHQVEQGLSDIWIDALDLLPGNGRALVGSGHGVNILDLRDGSIVRELTGTSDTILAAQVSPDETKVVAFSRDHTVYSWDIDSQEMFEKHRIAGSLFGQFVDVVFAPSSSRLALTSMEPVIRFPPAIFNDVKTYGVPFE